MSASIAIPAVERPTTLLDVCLLPTDGGAKVEIPILPQAPGCKVAGRLTFRGVPTAAPSSPSRATFPAEGTIIVRRGDKIVHEEKYTTKPAEGWCQLNDGKSKYTVQLQLRRETEGAALGIGKLLLHVPASEDATGNAQTDAMLAI